MDWNQIETKWAVMARRIRADVPCGKPDEGLVALRLGDKVDVPKRIVIKGAVAVNIKITQTRSPVLIP